MKGGLQVRGHTLHTLPPRVPPVCSVYTAVPRSSWKLEEQVTRWRCGAGTLGTTQEAGRAAQAGEGGEEVPLSAATALGVPASDDLERRGSRDGETADPAPPYPALPP